MMRGRRFLSAFYVVKTRTNAVRAMSRVPPKATLEHVVALLKDLRADFGALKTDVGALKTDVGALKTDIGSKMDVLLKRLGVSMRAPFGARLCGCSGRDTRSSALRGTCTA